MKKILLPLFTMVLLLNSLGLFAQETNSVKNKVYQANELLEDKFLNVEVKEYFVREIDKTDLVKDIDKHDLVHFYIDRFDSKYKAIITKEVSKFKTIDFNQGTIIKDYVIAKIVEDFKAYKLQNPNAPEFYNKSNDEAIDVNIFKLGAENGGDQIFGPGQPCNNADFETNSCVGWEVITGTVPSSPSAPYSFNQTGTSACGTSVNHTLMTGGNDPVVGAALPMVSPSGGGTSLRLGNGTGSGNGAAKIRQTFLVDANSAAFSYHYAVVLNDAGHTTNEQPYFKVNMFDAGGARIVCADYDVTAPTCAGTGSGCDPDFIAYAGGFYSPWRTAFAPLQGYIGQNVTIEFITGDCSQSGHYGYAYIDASCDPLAIIPSQTVICGGAPVTLTAPAGATSYSWSPGGQTTQSITTNVPGHYEVFVTPVTGSACGLTLTADIGGSPDYPVAQGSATPTSVCAGTPIAFNSTSYVVGPSAIDSIHWDFNSDGIVDNTTNSPNYTYPAAGNYTATLTVFNNGCQDDTTINITITPGTTSNFTAPAVCVGVPTTFTSSATPVAAVTMWNWDFDNNGTYDNNTQNPTYTFSAPGTYPVKLQVSGNAGACPDDTTINVVVHPKPNADFTATNQCLNTATTFVNNSNISSGTITGWSWDFESNGSVDNTTQTPTNTYGTAGTYNVTLIATSNNTCRDTANFTVEVYDNPVANFTTNTACENFATAFTNTSVQGDTTITGWQWDFDNNTTIDNTTQSPSNTYTNDGTYPVTLIVTDGHGCKDTVTNNVTVAPQPTAAFTFTNVCFGTTTGFTDLSNGNGGTINQWSWDFTNNGVVDNTTQNPTNGYTAAGSYTVELLVTTTTGCKDSVTMVVPVDPIPVANFSGTNECLGNITTFIDSSNVSTGSIASWAWNFGDGTGTSVAPSPTYTYALSGTFNVTLTVTSDSGCISNFNRNIQVYANPVANFSTDTACNTSATSFTDLTAIGSTAIQTWGWDFDNNGSADDNEQNPSFVFAGAGTYPVNLAVVDTFGCVHDTTMNVTVSENPIASYTYSNECYGTGTVFTDLSNNNGGTTPIDTWEWDYDGNGTIDNTTQSPTYTFPAAGTYQTELFVTSVLGCKDSVTIAVVVNPIPVANFSAANVCLNFVASFIDSSTVSTGSINSWDWDFGDGVGSSVLQNPTYIYPVAGNFNVDLTVTSDSGCTHNVVIPVTVNPKPTADFNVNNVCLNLAAPFTDASLGNGGTINQWAWDFTNNGSVDNTTQNPTNFYAAAGTFNVQLVATTTNGCKDTIVKPVTIHPMPDADFTFVNQCVSANVPFTDNSVVSTGTITVWDWKFGDGQSSMIQSPTHLYASQGIYNVQLIVTTNNNCSDTIAKNNIEVWPLPNVNFGPTSVCLNNLTQFVDSSTVSNSFTTNTNTQWSWNFGDGMGVSALQNPMYMYGSDGVFNATLIVTTNHNCVDSITKPVTVHPLPVVDFTPNIVSGCTPVCVTFTDNTVIGAGSTITQWNWDFTSDGIKDASSQNPMYCFTNPSHSSVRDYSIRLIATSNFGCKDTLTKVNYIHSNPIPLASFSYWPNDEASIVDNDITFTDQSIIASTWDWDLGDGATSNVQHPVHEYTDTGFYLVVLRIENEYGCRDTTQKIVNIKPIYAIWIPNAFTPNGDFSNDFFYVDGYGIKELQVKIFDRWGLKIYDEIGVDQSWDGTYNGNIVQTDVYVYKVRAKDIFDEWHDYIGKVTVIK